MIRRRLQSGVRSALASVPVVALLGARQVGKTTLAHEIVGSHTRPCVYLDLERDSDRSKLSDAEGYLTRHADKLVVLDEVQRAPDLFPLLRSLVDERRRAGDRVGHFLLLGSASPDLLRQASETLAGRIRYLELAPLSLTELVEHAEIAGQETAPLIDRLWLRGGFPDSLLAAADSESWAWRTDFISTYLERDIPQLGLRLPAERLRRLWSMLAVGQGAQLNVARLASGLGVSGHTVRHYLDLLVDLYMVRLLRPWSGNSAKRLVKSPKVYVRDAGLTHRLAQVPDIESLLGNPLCGPSWEAFVIEALLVGLPDTERATYYRTGGGAEIDLVLEGSRGVRAFEVKRSLAPKPSKGFQLGADEVGANRRYYVMPSGERHSLGHGVEAIGLLDLLREPV